VTDLESVEAYLDGKEARAVELFRGFQRLVEACGISEAAPRRTIVYWNASVSSRAPISNGVGWS
jgi:hypothetical protein